MSKLQNILTKRVMEYDLKTVGNYILLKTLIKKAIQIMKNLHLLLLLTIIPLAGLGQKLPATG